VHTPNSAWITTSVAAMQTGIPKRTIIAAINRGDLRADKLPGLTGSFLIAPKDLQRWLAKRSAAA
jgi:excisionase family DNA binding protein